ncbi:MAG: hypothetical protein QY322_03915 [bacterium]|nr:MAG: hypothetical protein QY322_03915 [bacterium]
MNPKPLEKKNAIKLRKLGYSYSEILKEVKVSKSSLSSWLRDVKITNSQIDRLRLKNSTARKLGSIVLKRNRIEKTKAIINKAKLEIGKLDQNYLKVIGTVLYWTEGSKQKEHNPSKELVFTNSDVNMIKIYLLWLRKCLSIKPEDIKFEIYIHETYNKTQKELILFWAKISGFTKDNFKKIYFKKNKVNSFRKNRGKEYNGVLRVSVKRSTDINRKVMGWVEGICLQFQRS